MNQPTLFGWTPLQWKKANDYYNLCTGESIVLDFFKAVEEYLFGKVDLSKFLQVNKFWCLKRLDKPGEIEIEIPVRYRSRQYV